MNEQDKAVAQIKSLVDALIKIGELPMESNTRARAIAQDAINKGTNDFLSRSVEWREPITPEQIHKILYRDSTLTPAPAAKIKEMEKIAMDSKNKEQTPVKTTQESNEDRPGKENNPAPYIPPAIEMIPVESSKLESVGHDGDKILRVKFKNSGSAAYDYVGIEPEDFFGLINSDSVGKAQGELCKEKRIKGIKIEVPEV